MSDSVLLRPDQALLRERFPIFEHQIYVNSCSQGALSLDVRQAYAAYLRDWDERGSPWEYWVEQSEAARAAFARLIHVAPDEVAVVTSVSQGVSALASALRFDGPRRKIVMSDFEFPTIGQIWHAQELRGARVEIVPAAGNVIPPENFERAIDDETLLVSITHVCYRNGSRLDVPAIVELAHRHGALVLLDSYQALGTMPIDARTLGVDFLAGGVLKYLLGSAGLAFLYVKQELIDSLQPTAMGWFSHEDIFAMDHRSYRPSPTARRFEAGTPPIPSIYAGLAGMNLVLSIGMEAVQHQIRALTSALIDGAQELGFSVVTPVQPEQHGALITLRSTDVITLVERLASDHIITSSRAQNLRISPHFYNSIEDIERVLEALQRNREYLV